MASIPSAGVTVAATSSEKSNYKSALISLAVLYFMMGFITCLNDTLVPFFKAGFALSYTQSSLVQFYFFLTYGIMSIPSGKLVSRIGYKKGMVVGFFIAAFGALLFLPASLFHLYELFLMALFVLATGIVLLQVSANPYVTVLGSPETASSRLTLIQGVGSVGTTIAPVFGSVFILSSLNNTTDSSEAVRIPYLALSVCLVVIAIVLLKLRLPEIRTEDVNEDSSPTTKKVSIFSYRNLNLGMIGIFMYVGAEVAIGTFLTNYIADRIHVSESIANNYVAFYWGGMLAGRFIGSFLLRSVRPNAMLTVLSLLSVLLIITSLLSRDYLSIWAIIAVGICNSVMFAIIFSLSIRGLGKTTTIASGLLSTAIVGGSVISFGVGFLKDRYSWEIAFSIPVICYLYILFYGLYGYKSVNNTMRPSKYS